MDFDDLFNEGASEILQQETPAVYSFAEDLVNELESEYTGKTTIRIDRIKEREKLKLELKETNKKIRNMKNPKAGSATRRQILTKNASQKREKLRNKAARIKVKLDELAIECGEPIESEKKELREEEESKRKEQENAKYGGWSSISPYSEF